MKTLCIDLGTTMGWCFFNEAHCFYGVEEFSSSKSQGHGVRYLRFKSFLTKTKNSYEGLDEVYYEEVHRHCGTQAAHVYGGFKAILQMWCEHYQIKCSGLEISHIKKAVTGKANAKKNKVIDAVQNLGFKTDDDNTADAIAMMVLVEKRRIK